ncbi:MAG: response regulator [Thermodesulfobacteriota bacterium]
MLRGKTILAVDDEPDILETIVDLLESCRIDTAASFRQAQDCLLTKNYDLAILDVMGVKGLHLLDLAVRRKIPSVMLTAPAVSTEYIIQAQERGAMAYIFKEEMGQLETLLVQLFEVLARGEAPWAYTMKRIAPILDERLAPGWRNKLIAGPKQHPDR